MALQMHGSEQGPLRVPVGEEDRRGGVPAEQPAEIRVSRGQARTIHTNVSAYCPWSEPRETKWRVKCERIIMLNSGSHGYMGHGSL